MHTKRLGVYTTPPKRGVTNEYPTGKHSFRQPCLQLIVGQRTAGKSYLTAMMLQEFKKEATFDRVYLITPSFQSNASYWRGHIEERDVFEPTKNSILDVIQRVEADRDEWERFLGEKERYDKFQRTMIGDIEF